MKKLYGLILAGGSGTRLWPISREYYPKQFLKILGDETLIQQTFTRLKKIIPPKKIYITTNRIFVDEIINQLKSLGLDEKNIILQPTDKNTGPAIAQASKKIYDEDNSAIIVTCPSDHLIESQLNFDSCIRSAYKLAQKNLLVTFGIKPTEPNSEYGYIVPEKSNTLPLNPNISFKVKAFVEKPLVHKAKKLIKKGALWNSGIFIWKAKSILDEINKLNPNLYQTLNSYKKYFSLDSISVDNSILEKSHSIWVIPANFDWKDIGSWKALYELLPKDSNENVLNNRTVVYNCKKSLVYGTDGRFITAINLDDIIVVDTKDHVLVTHRENTQGIKEAIKKIGELEENLQKPLITIITPTFNNQYFIENTITSILNQNYKNIEYIVIDGNSTDKTLTIINKYRYRIEQFLTMPNANIFEKMNKGIELANGEIIGILKPGDSYIDNKVIEDVVENMEKNKTEVIWGDLVYISNHNSDKISMYWKSSEYKKGILQQGWIPPHPTFFVKRKTYEKCGNFNVKFNIAAEYELMLRLLRKYKIPSCYIPRILVKMTGEGISFKSILDRFKGNLQTFRSWKENGLEINPLILFSKNISKVSQFLKKA